MIKRDFKLGKDLFKTKDDIFIGVGTGYITPNEGKELLKTLK